MTKLFDRRSTLVFVLAVLALVVGMSSTAAYAATVAAKNSVLSRSIKNGQVKSVDLASSAVTGAKIADGQVGAADLANGAVTTGKVANGSVTSAKIADGTLTGADLGEGAVGAQNLTAATTFYATSSSVGDADGTTNGGDHASVQVVASCPAEWTPISGGADWVSPSVGSVATKNLYLHTSAPTSSGWLVRGTVDIGAQGTVQLRARVVCLPPWPAPQQ